MRDHQENIPPWKKEVLMRRDGLSKAVEQDLSITNLCDSISKSSSSHQANGFRNARYRLGSNSSALSKADNYFPTEGHVRSQTNGRVSNYTSNTGIYSFR